MPDKLHLPAGWGGDVDGAFGVACCGCMRMLDKAGKPRDVNGGLVPRSEIAWFPDPAAADKTAAAAGWSVKDSAGPNHRCPECIKAERAADPPNPRGEQRRGAYIAIAAYPGGRL